MAQRDEVEEFLRRAAARRAQAQGLQGQAPRPMPPPQPPQQVYQPPPRPATLAQVVIREPLPAQPVEAELIEPELVEIGSSVARSVAEHMRGTQQIADHARQLGAEVDQADDKLEARLHQVFDHKVGQLQVRATANITRPGEGAQTGAAFTPGDIAQMLLSPASIRSAIVLSEVLRRPEWERTEEPKNQRTK